MDIFDQIIENLELERDLGTRTVEFDRALLVPPKPVPAKSAQTIAEPSHSAPSHAPTGGAVRPQVAATSAFDVAFVSGARLSPAGMEMLEKIVAAVKKLKPGASVGVVNVADGGGVAGSKVVLLLGLEAVKALRPDLSRVVRGRWIDVSGIPALPAFSPDYILSHFDAGSSNLDAAKRELWGAVKAAIARLP